MVMKETIEPVVHMVVRNSRGLAIRLDVDGNEIPWPKDTRPPRLSAVDAAEYETGVPAHVIQSGIDFIYARMNEPILWEEEDALLIAEAYRAMRAAESY
jgi:hypothetical protein